MPWFRGPQSKFEQIVTLNTEFKLWRDNIKVLCWICIKELKILKIFPAECDLKSEIFSYKSYEVDDWATGVATNHLPRQISRSKV